MTIEYSTAENRHKGAMLFVHRNAKFFTFLEDGKNELVAGGGNVFRTAEHNKISVFAGGQQGSESVAENVFREFREEMGEAMNEDFADSCLFPSALPLLYQQAYPLVVAQISQSERKINEVAATAVSIEFDQLNREVQKQMEKMIVEQKAFWLGFQTLVTFFELMKKTKKCEVGGVKFRPQVLVAGMIYSMEKIQKVDAPDIIHKIKNWNRGSIRYLQQFSELNCLPINNGVFTTKGSIRQSLSDAEKKYLVPTYE